MKQFTIKTLACFCFAMSLTNAQTAKQENAEANTRMDEKSTCWTLPILGDKLPAYVQISYQRNLEEDSTSGSDSYRLDYLPVQQTGGQFTLGKRKAITFSIPVQDNKALCTFSGGFATEDCILLTNHGTEGAPTIYLLDLKLNKMYSAILSGSNLLSVSETSRCIARTTRGCIYSKPCKWHQNRWSTHTEKGQTVVSLQLGRDARLSQATLNLCWRYTIGTGQSEVINQRAQLQDNQVIPYPHDTQIEWKEIPITTK